jgi:hypothetical protein
MEASMPIVDTMRGLPKSKMMNGVVDVRSTSYKMPTIERVVSDTTVGLPKDKVFKMKTKPPATKMPMGSVQVELH